MSNNRQIKDKLTPQQRKLLTLISAEPGLTSVQLADRLGSSRTNVKAQLSYMRPRLKEIGLAINCNGYTVRGLS